MWQTGLGDAYFSSKTYTPTTEELAGEPEPLVDTAMELSYEDEIAAEAAEMSNVL